MPAMDHRSRPLPPFHSYLRLVAAGTPKRSRSQRIRKLLTILNRMMLTNTTWKQVGKIRSVSFEGLQRILPFMVKSGRHRKNPVSRVLIVDDDCGTLETFGAVLRLAGHDAAL